MIENISNLDRSTDLLILFYEDLQKDAFGFAKQIINHIRINVTDAELKKSLPGIVNSSRYSRLSMTLQYLKLGWFVKSMKIIGVKKFLDFFVVSKKIAAFPDDILDKLDASVTKRLKNNDLILFKHTKRKYFKGANSE